MRYAIAQGESLRAGLKLRRAIATPILGLAVLFSIMAVGLMAAAVKIAGDDWL